MDTFWITSHHALIVSTFIALGRIFDQASKHNVDRLMHVIERNLVDMADIVWDAVPRFDDGFYTSIARMIGEEPVQPRDAEMTGITCGAPNFSNLESFGFFLTDLPFSAA